MRYVAFVRNIMVGREGLHRDVLLRLLAEARARDGASHLATGNVSFDAEPAELAELVRRLEAGIAEVVGRREPVVVREVAFLARLVADDPFRGFDAEWDREVSFLPLTAPPIEPGSVSEVPGLRVVAVGVHEVADRWAAGRSAPQRQLTGRARLRSPGDLPRLEHRRAARSVGLRRPPTVSLEPRAGGGTGPWEPRYTWFSRDWTRPAPPSARPATRTFSRFEG